MAANAVLKSEVPYQDKCQEQVTPSIRNYFIFCLDQSSSMALNTNKLLHEFLIRKVA